MLGEAEATRRCDAAGFTNEKPVWPTGAPYAAVPVEGGASGEPVAVAVVEVGFGGVAPSLGFGGGTGTDRFTWAGEAGKLIFLPLCYL
jgi:hypothetical protein